MTQPDIIAEIADFFIRFEQVNWSLAAGVFEDQLKLSLRAGGLGGKAGEVLYTVVNGLGSAGGHDQRAGGAVVLADHRPETVESLLRSIRGRLLDATAYRRAARPQTVERVSGHPGALSEVLRSSVGAARTPRQIGPIGLIGPIRRISCAAKTTRPAMHWAVNWKARLEISTLEANVP